jgi:Spy/CpxP family protein refolding chaperone
MNGKIILSVFTALFLCTGSVYANKMMMTADEKVQKMKKELNLTDDQVNQVRPIIQEYKDKMDALMQEKETKLSSVLTLDQMNKMKKMKNEKY